MIAMAPPRPSRPRTDEYSPSLPGPALPPPPQTESPSVPATGQAGGTRIPLVPGPAAASVARAHLRAAISSWELAVDVDVAVLLVSELVTNAVTHGDAVTSGDAVTRGDEGTGAFTAVTMLVRCSGGELRVEVHDRSVHMPFPTSLQAPEDSETGRGLMLVDTLATEWGYYRTPGGKAVYFTLPLTDSQRASSNGSGSNGSGSNGNGSNSSGAGGVPRRGDGGS